MIAIIQGEILHTDQLESQEWLEELKGIFKRKNQYPQCWDSFPGDVFEFQEKPQTALQTLIHIMACIRKYPPLDIRIVIGIGAMESPSLQHVKPHTFAIDAANLKFQEILEGNVSIGIKSQWAPFDDAMNLIFQFATLLMRDWSPRAAEIIKVEIENPEMDQREIGRKFGISQSSVSERLSRAHYDEILQMDQYYRKQLQQLIQ